MTRAAKRAPSAGVNGTSLLSISAAEYFADPCLEPSLSASIAHTLVTVSPLQAWADHPRLGGVARKPKDVTERGDLFHALLLGAGKGIEVIPGFDNWTKKEAQALRQAARDAGRTPVLEHVHDDAQSACRVIRGRLEDLGVELDLKRSELGMFWVDHTTDGEPVQCRALVDNWARAKATEYDLKSCTKPTREAITRKVGEYGAHLQRAAYRRGLEANESKLAGRIQHRLIFFGVEPPFDVVPVRLSATFLALGEQLWQRALDTWAQCRRSGFWPGALGEEDEMLVEPYPWQLQRASGE